MPELPEVETVRRSLKTKVLNEVFKDVNVYYSNIIENPNVDEFKSNLIGQTILDIDRRGKWLIFVLNDYHLLTHLRMEGKFFIKDCNDKLNKHEHVVFKFDSGLELRYNDTRKFGKMYLIDKRVSLECKPLKDLGLEPWDDKLDSKYLLEKYNNKRLPIKSVLLDQSIITGIGNIYADEILYLSNINPLRKVSTLTNDECYLIIKYTREVLEKAIKLGGTTIRTYESSEGVHGRFQNNLIVHNHEGDICPKCANKIVKIKVGGRGTYYCNICQK